MGVKDSEHLDQGVQHFGGKILFVTWVFIYTVVGTL